MSKEYFGTGRLRTRQRRCHEIAATALVIKDETPEGTTLVCGIADRRVHSWLELPDGSCWDPVTCEVASGPDGGLSEVSAIRYRLTGYEVAVMLSGTGHYGSWTPDELAELEQQSA